MDNNELNLSALTAEIVSAYVANNTLVREQVPDLISSVYAALNRTSTYAGEQLKEELKPAVSIKKSVTDDYIICLEDGKKFKSLKRHLRTHYDLSPEEYRERWGLAHDYPMVAPAYAAARSQLAKTMGLGQRRRQDDAARLGAGASGAKSAKSSAKGAVKRPPSTVKASRK